MELDLHLTRSCLELMLLRDFRVQIVTKSDLILRDIDLLQGMRSCVAITLTTNNQALAARLEPGAPSPNRRLVAIRRLSEAKIPVCARLDPLIPGINDGDVKVLVQAVAEAGARHVTTSTYKAKPDSWKRLYRSFPAEMEMLKPLYFEQGKRMGGSRYLPLRVRQKLLNMVGKECQRVGLTCSTCREGIAPETSCDGSHLIR
jgi:DNA repair photolyase